MKCEKHFSIQLQSDFQYREGKQLSDFQTERNWDLLIALNKSVIQF
jgi:hypothetical protein